MNKRLIEIFLRLVEIEGLSGDEKNVAHFIKSFLADLGLSPFEDDSYKITGSSSGNVICRIGDGGDTVLVSHMDTAVSTAGVKPVCMDDRIASDGTSVLGVDNRAGVSILLAMVEEVIKEKIAVKGFTLAFTTCEETTLGGSKNLRLGDKIVKGFVFDSFKRPGNYISESLGAASFAVEVKGKASHSGIAPEKGVSSIKIASLALVNIPVGRISSETTVNVGRIEGGTSVNVVPENTKVKGEVRSVSIDEVKKSLNMIEKEFLRYASVLGGEIKFGYQWDFLPYRLNGDSAALREINNAIIRSGLTPVPAVSWGGSDANSLNSIGIEAVNIGIGAQNPHSNDEFIFIEDLQKSREIAMELVKS